MVESFEWTDLLELINFYIWDKMFRTMQMTEKKNDFLLLRKAAVFQKSWATVTKMCIYMFCNAALHCDR